MRAKLLVIAVLAVGIIGILIASLFSGNKKPVTTVTDTCTQLITDIENTDAKASYNLFTQNLKNQTNYSAWQGQVNGLSVDFSGLPAQFKGQTITTPATKTTPASVRRDYTIANIGVDYNVQCFLAPAGKGYAIDGFSMQRAAQQ